MRDQPSKTHPNRQAHNWVAYDSTDRMLCANTARFRGVLYDLGCGESPYKDWLSRYVDRYVGVDWSDSLHPGNADVVANLNKPLPIEDAVADTLLSISVLEHLVEPQLMLSEACRILKPGGNLVLQVPWQWRIHEAPHDYYRYTPYGLRHLLSQAGFTDIEIEPQAGAGTTIILKLNYLSLRLIRGRRGFRGVIRALLSVGWQLGQRLAPLLDRLDRNWAAEAPGYFVTARKPQAPNP
jgi:SAM-dependent methyltransferase